MKMKTLPPSTEVALWLRILDPDGELRPTVARALLRLSFPERDRKRMHTLSAKARAGTLTADEENEAGDFERVGAVLSTLKSKARQVLKENRRGSK